jgi:hypothetical protein
LSCFSLFDWWQTLTRRPRTTRRPRRTALQLETLEDRNVPSTFQVTNFLDSGASSLRQAVLDANAHPGADVILFAGGLTGTIPLASDELSVTDALTIVVSGNDASRVFETGAPAWAAALTTTPPRL